jgi:hypothetical protein
MTHLDDNGDDDFRSPFSCEEMSLCPSFPLLSQPEIMMVASIRIVTVANLFMVVFSVYHATIPVQASTPFVVITPFGVSTNENGPAFVSEKLEGLSEINGALPDATNTQAISFAMAAVNTIFNNFQHKLFP